MGSAKHEFDTTDLQRDIINSTRDIDEIGREDVEAFDKSLKEMQQKSAAEREAAQYEFDKQFVKSLIPFLK